MLIARAHMRATSRRYVDVVQARRNISWLRSLSSTPPNGNGAEGASGAGEASQEGESEEMLSLREKLADLEAQLRQKHDQLLRSRADAENMRKRTTIDVENANKFGISSFAKSLLEVADNLERAIELVPESVRSGTSSDPNHVLMKALYNGIKMTDEQLLKSFATVSIVRINPLGEKFDPSFHEGLFEVPDPSKEPGTVATCLSVGYKLHERSLRSAKVGIVAKP